MEGVIGVDLGGTHVRAGVLDRQGKVLSWAEAPIEARRGPEAGVKRINGVIRQALSGAGGVRLLGIGIGSTGPLDREKGAIQNPWTLPTWEYVDIISPLERSFGVPALLENDADAAVLGEYWQGAGQGVRRLAMVTLGTGVGWAFVYDGEVYRGIDGSHPEGGHIILDPCGPLCYCGSHGCWEVLCAGPGIAQRARQAILDGRIPTALLKMAGGNLEKVEGSLVAQAAAAGDPLAREIMEKTAYYIGLGLINLIRLLLPERILLTGGVTHSYDTFRPTIEAMLTEHNTFGPVEKIEIRLASLGQRAGVIGAGYAILHQLEKDS